MPVRFSLALFLLLAPRQAHAQVILQTDGRTIPLRLKAETARVAISHQCASTNLLLTFQNEAAYNIQAEFIYTVPEGAVVTYFAYWCGAEKVVARIVEKERAAQIYGSIVSRNSDPTLVQMIGKNRFRASIFPVMANADLKVEIRMVQSLPFTAQGALFTLPLKPLEAGKGTFDALDVAVRVAGDDAIGRVTNNFGVTSKRAGNDWLINYRAKNARPGHDFQVNLVRPSNKSKVSPPLRVALAAKAGRAAPGYFALSLTAAKPLARPRLHCRGVQLSDVISGAPARLVTGQTWRVVGRYRGAGPATVLVQGVSGSRTVTLIAPVVFPRRAAQPAAVKFWAAARLAQLGEDFQQRAAIIALSKRYTLPGYFTSWLAVPKKEMAHFQLENSYATLGNLTRLLFAENDAGRSNSKAARQARASLHRVCRRIDVSYADYMHDQLYYHRMERLDMLAHDIVFSHQSLANLQPPLRQAGRDYIRLCRAVGVNPHYYMRAVSRSQDGNLYRDPGRPAFDIVHLHFSEKLSRRKERSLYAQLLYSAGGYRAQWDWLQRSLSNYMEYEVQPIAFDYVRARHTAPHAPATRRLKRRLQWAESRARTLTTNVSWSGYKISALIDTAESWWNNARAHKTAYRLLRERASAAPDPRYVAHLETSLRHMAGPRDKEFIQWEKYRVDSKAKEPTMDELFRVRHGDPLISVDAPADARQVIALVPGQVIKTLLRDPATGKWEARFDVPTHAAPGDFPITIIIVLQNGARKTWTLHFHVDVTAPHGHGLARLVASPAAANCDLDRAKPDTAKPDTAKPDTLRLELATDPDTTRVSALLPWGEKYELKASTWHRDSFFGLVPVPLGQPPAGRVTYILTDRAHNRTNLTVALES